MDKYIGESARVVREMFGYAKVGIWEGRADGSCNMKNGASDSLGVVEWPGGGTWLRDANSDPAWFRSIGHSISSVKKICPRHQQRSGILRSVFVATYQNTSKGP